MILLADDQTMMIDLSEDDKMIVLAADLMNDEDFVALLKDDMAVELIRESGGRTLNGRILRSGRLAVEYSLLFLPLSKCSPLFLPSSISRAAQESSSKSLMGAEWDDGTGQKIDWSLAVYVTPCSKSKELASNSPFHDHQLSFA